MSDDRDDSQVGALGIPYSPKKSRNARERRTLLRARQALEDELRRHAPQQQQQLPSPPRANALRSLFAQQQSGLGSHPLSGLASSSGSSPHSQLGGAMGALLDPATAAQAMLQQRMAREQADEIARLANDPKHRQFFSDQALEFAQEHLHAKLVGPATTPDRPAHKKESPRPPQTHRDSSREAIKQRLLDLPPPNLPRAPKMTLVDRLLLFAKKVGNELLGGPRRRDWETEG